jgi:hypothetical protein
MGEIFSRLSNDIVFNINNVNSSKVTGWIVDLRLNTEGNMYPILLGLKDLIGNNVVFGGFRDSEGRSTGDWEIRDGKMMIDGEELERKSILNIPVNHKSRSPMSPDFGTSVKEMILFTSSKSADFPHHSTIFKK